MPCGRRRPPVRLKLRLKLRPKKRHPEGVFFLGTVIYFTVTYIILGASLELCVMVTFFFIDQGRI